MEKHSLILGLELPDGVENLVGGLGDGESALLATGGRVDRGGEAVDLADCEPGQRGEQEVEEVLSNVDHDVLILEYALFHHIPRKKT